MQDIYDKIFEKEPDEMFSTLATPVLLANGKVPSTHREIANNYIVIKRLYKTPALKSLILNEEWLLLNKYDLKPLSQLTIQDMNKEILFLQTWSFSGVPEPATDADKIMQIRAKELRHILSSNYCMYTKEINDGYKALERYFEEITKFYNLPH